MRKPLASIATITVARDRANDPAPVAAESIPNYWLFARGERRSTWRFDTDPPYDLLAIVDGPDVDPPRYEGWTLLQPGDIVRYYRRRVMR